MTCCPEIKRGYLRHLQNWMYEVPENYKTIVGIYTSGIEITEFTKLLPKTVDLWCKLPEDLSCPEVAYLKQESNCQDCNCCN